MSTAARNPITVCFLSLLASCTSEPNPPAIWNSIHTGMLQTDVRSLLGEPDAILPQPIEPPQDPDEWCLTLSLWKIEGPVQKWVYRGGDEQTLIIDFDYAGKVMEGPRVVLPHAQ